MQPCNVDSSKPGTGDLSEFYIPFLRCYLSKLFHLLHRALWFGWGQAPGAVNDKALSHTQFREDTGDSTALPSVLVELGS